MTRYPIVRHFGTTDWGQRADAFADIERRVRELEAAYGLQNFQSGYDEELAQVTITDYSGNPSPSSGGPAVTIEVPGPEALVVIYYEFDGHINGSGGSNIVADIYIDTEAASAQIGYYTGAGGAIWHNAIVPPNAEAVHLGSTSGGTHHPKAPRGSRRALSFLPAGTHTLELRHRHVASGGVGTDTAAYVRNRKLWVDVL